jgi:hypothetical protein
MESFKEKLDKAKREKGQVGGVTILIGTVSALFIIGFLVMIYALVGGALLESDAISNDSVAYTVLNDTIDALSDVVTWFAIIIVITVMVVLILLTTLIIRAIRGTGFTESA